MQDKMPIADLEPLEPRVGRKALMVSAIGLIDLIDRDVDEMLRLMNISRSGFGGMLTGLTNKFREVSAADMEFYRGIKPEEAFKVGLMQGIIVGVRAVRFMLKGKDFINDVFGKVERGELLSEEDAIQCEKCGRRGRKPPDHDDRMSKAMQDARAQLEELGMAVSDEDVKPAFICIDCAKEMVMEMVRP